MEKKIMAPPPPTVQGKEPPATSSIPLPQKGAGASSLLRLWLAVGLVGVGVLLLFLGLILPPLGVIDGSVLIAFGEVLTFSGALFGIDYSYRIRYGRVE